MENIEIRKMEKIKGNWVKCEVAFKTSEFGILVVKGWRIRESHNEGEIWVQEPSYQVFRNYIRCFFAEDRKVWDELKATLIEAYGNYLRSSGNEEEKIDLNDIPDDIGTST